MNYLGRAVCEMPQRYHREATVAVRLLLQY